MNIIPVLRGKDRRSGVQIQLQLHSKVKWATGHPVLEENNKGRQKWNQATLLVPVRSAVLPFPTSLGVLCCKALFWGPAGGAFFGHVFLKPHGALSPSTAAAMLQHRHVTHHPTCNGKNRQI